MQIVRGELFGIKRLCPVMPNSVLRDRFFYPHKTTRIDSFSCIPFDLQCLILTSHVDVRHTESWCRMWCRNDVNSQRLTNRAKWLPIQPSIHNTSCYSFFITCWIRVCKIRLFGTGNCRKPCRVCKNYVSISTYCQKLNKFWSFG